MNIKGMSATRALALAALVVSAACFDEERVNVASPSTQAEVELGVRVSSLTAQVGDRITIAVEATSASELGGVQGHLRFDPSRLQFLGQIPDRNAIVIINRSAIDRGSIRLAAFSPTAMESSVAKFAFQVRSPAYSNGIAFDVELVSDLRQQRLRTSLAREVGIDTQLPAADEPVDWTYLDWAMFWDPSIKDRSGDTPTSIPGLPVIGRVYGNVRTDALSPNIDVLDASDIANTSVGNREVIIGTDTVFTVGVDRVTTGNVRPVPAGACTVAGFDDAACTVRTINVSDAQAVSQESVCPAGAAGDACRAAVLVVGDAIPLPKYNGTNRTDTVLVPAQTITGTRRFDRDSLYILTGLVTVGIEAGAAGELVVEDGTWVEGRTTAAIFVTRNGRLIADGTATRPITFTCVPPRVMQCWGGIFIAGNAHVNEQDATLTTGAPVIPGRNPAGGENQRAGEGGAVNHGGGNDADSSGVLRYVRIMYGGSQGIATNNELNDLTIGSCGSKTVLEHIQVHGGSDDGLEIFGGRCNVKYLFATANDDDNFDYSFGYDGNVQYVFIQHKRVGGPSAGDMGFEVDNTETAATYGTDGGTGSATPRTQPQVYNVTYVGTSANTHNVFRRGAGSKVRNVIAVGGQRFLRIGDGAETATCTAAAQGDLSFNNIALLDVTVTDTMVAYSTGTVACATVPVGADTVRATYTSQLKSPFNVMMPDLRPVGSGITGVAAENPPAVAFFDRNPSGSWFVGAVPPINFLGGPFIPFNGSVSWYMGWTLPWQAPGTI
jgi:hypothetical protein